MPPRNRKSSPEGSSDERPSFEQSLGELEKIVEQMENEQLPLNQLIDQYEKGVRLFTACDQLLGEARERLELITLKARQDSSATQASSVDSTSTETGEHDDDDIRLF